MLLSMNMGIQIFLEDYSGAAVSLYPHQHLLSGVFVCLFVGFVCFGFESNYHGGCEVEVVADFHPVT